MSGWVGLDTSGAIFHRYGVESRPTTIIIDGNGRIVAVTEIDSLGAADLQALARGKTVAFKPAMEVTEASVPSRPDAERPLFSVAVTKARADAKMSRVNHPPTGTDLLGDDADSLITDVFNVFGNRYVMKGPLPDGRYDVRVTSAEVPQPVNDSAVQQAVLAALHLQIQSKTLTRPAYILRATDASKRLLSPSASTHAVKRGYWHGKFLLMNGTMDDLTYVLATGLENPVINETSIDGTYDARFQVAGGNVDSLNAVLKETLGLELVPGNQEVSITVLEVSKQEESKPPASTKTQQIKH
jgi:uncharacterized protein (TIGR03435 family)